MRLHHFLQRAVTGMVIAAVPTISIYSLAQNPIQNSTSLKSAKSEAVALPDPQGNNNSSSVQNRVLDKDNNQATTPMSLKKVFINLPGDQKTIWTFPFRLSPNDSTWAFPVMGTAGVLFASDHRNMLRERSSRPAISLSDNISNGGTITLVAVPAMMYVLGNAHGDSRLRETGLLSGEALINSVIVAEGLKFAFGRERPTVTDGHGRFFQNFSDPSFPSDHSMLSWTTASVIAHEYPGFISQSLAYATAATVSVSRVTGRKHFPSDVFAGAVMGWFIGRQVYRAHHDPDLDTAEYGSFIPQGRRLEGPQTGTGYVPIDSWVYPALERLAALGYIRSALSGLRPWTRSECARLVQEAAESIDPLAPGTLPNTLRALNTEFSPEIEGQETAPRGEIEQIYTRNGYVAGDPLADDYHFAKTFTNDYGRPFGRGFNNVTGLSARSIVGPLTFYVRGEYQHAGPLPALNGAAQAAVAAVDLTPTSPSERVNSVDRFRFLDSYLSFTFHNNVVSFGKQTLWWGPGADGPFLASNNAEPLPMLRISRASPFVLPWIFGLMGPTRFELFWGQLGGQQFVRIIDSAAHAQVVAAPLHPHPAIQGVKLSFKPTKNLEFGFGVTTIFSGPGFPLTLHSLLRSYSPSNANPGFGNDPGDRRSAFDFSYRIPGFRKWLTLYSDSFTEDEFSPISFPRKSSFRAGLYMPQLPKLPNVDLRVEGIYTDIPNLGAPGVEYFNTHYLSGYTNYGQIIGNAIGREGRGLNAWTTYRFGALNNVQLHYRNQHVNPEFLLGGYLQDFGVSGTVAKAGSIVFDGAIQYEHWHFPLLATNSKSNLSVNLQISYRPLHGLRISH